MSPTPTPRLGTTKEMGGVNDITTTPPGANVGVVEDLPRVILIRLTQMEINRYSGPHQFTLHSKKRKMDEDCHGDNPMDKKDGDLCLNLEAKITKLGLGDINWVGNAQVGPSTPCGEYKCKDEVEEVEEVAVKIEQDDWDYDAFEMDKYLYYHQSFSKLDNTMTNSISPPVKKGKYKRKYRKKRKKLNYYYKPRQTVRPTTTTPTTTTAPRRGRRGGIHRPQKILTVEEVLNQPSHSQNIEGTPIQSPDNNPQHNHDDGFTPALRQRQRQRKLHEPDVSDFIKKPHPIAIEMSVLENMDIDSIPGPPFNCSIPKCTGAFKSRQQLNVHLHEKHVVSQCPVCGEQFRSMRHHISYYHQGYYDQYKHMFNNGMRQSKYDAMDEEQFEKLDLSSFLKLGPPYNCPISNCSLEFKSIKSSRSHIWEKHVLKSCPVCKGLFRNVKAHVYKVHRKEFNTSFPPLQGIALERRRPCPVCSKMYFNRSTLKRHVMEMHDPIRKFYCSFCETTFQTRYLRYQHVRNLHPTNATELGKCPHPQCGRAFQTLAQLRFHRQKEHLTSSEGVSPVVIQELPGSNNLNQHPEGRLGLPQGIEGGYACHVCSKTYNDKTALNNHQETHDRKYGCLMCEKQFQTHKGRHHHMRYSHPRSLTELEKCPHPQCGRTFQTLGQLKNHRQRQHPRKQSVGDSPIIIQEQEEPEKNVMVYETKFEPRIIEIPGSFVTGLNSSIVKFEDN